MGRQPWIVQGLLKTADAQLAGRLLDDVAFSLTVFVCLYPGCSCVDFWLMRRYAKVDPPELDRDETGADPDA